MTSCGEELHNLMTEFQSFLGFEFFAFPFIQEFMFLGLLGVFCINVHGLFLVFISVCVPELDAEPL